MDHHMMAHMIVDNVSEIFLLTKEHRLAALKKQAAGAFTDDQMIFLESLFTNAVEAGSWHGSMAALAGVADAVPSAKADIILLLTEIQGLMQERAFRHPNPNDN